MLIATPLTAHLADRRGSLLALTLGLPNTPRPRRGDIVDDELLASSGYPYPMTSLDPADLSRKVRQHDDDLLSLYELVERLEGKVDAGFARVDTQLSEVNGKVDAGFARVDTQLSEVNGKVDAGLAQVDTQLSEVNGKLDLLLRRLDPRPGE